MSKVTIMNVIYYYRIQTNFASVVARGTICSRRDLCLDLSRLFLTPIGHH